jgi:IS4 transposase
LFFKAMKQNLQIKTFLSTSENAVKSQIYSALIS